MVRFSHCCNPVPGDDIVGFVTRGRGVSVHRSDCPNAQDLRRHPERIIEVHWADTAPSGKVSFNVEILIEALDRLNLLLDVAKVFADNGANVLSVSSTTHRDSMVEMRFLFQVSDTTAISRILQRLQSVEGVFEARRMMPNATSDSK